MYIVLRAEPWIGNFLVSILVFIYLFSSSPSPQHHHQSHHHHQHVVENVSRTRNKGPASCSHFALHSLCDFGEISWPFWPSFPKGTNPGPLQAVTQQFRLRAACSKAAWEQTWASCHMQNTCKTHTDYHLHALRGSYSSHTWEGPSGPTLCRPRSWATASALGRSSVFFLPPLPTLSPFPPPLWPPYPLPGLAWESLTTWETADHLSPRCTSALCWALHLFFFFHNSLSSLGGWVSIPPLYRWKDWGSEWNNF